MTSELSRLSLTDRPLGEIVKDDFRAAAVLSRFGLDFCCGGHQTLAEAADRRQIPVEPVADAIVALGQPGAEDRADRRWPELNALTYHIVTRHHEYVRAITPTITAWLEKLVLRHGDRHPELVALREVFGRLALDLTQHMMKEENVLFPYIDELANAARTGTRLPSGPFGTVLNPVRVMEEDHRRAAELVDEVRQLTSDYTPPADACATYRFCFAELERFDADLKTHVHLENHVLFPEAIELEERLL
jgi:regulator of cell morphogenesis and NO signaling